MTSDRRYICPSQVIDIMSFDSDPENGFHPYLMSFFELPLVRNGKFPWELTYGFMTDYSPHFRCAPYLNILSCCFKEKLLEYDCPSAHLVSCIVNLSAACATDSWRSANVIIQTQFRREEQILSPRDGVRYRLLDFGKIIQLRDLRFLKILIRYGIIRSTVSQSDIHPASSYSMLMLHWCQMADPNRLEAFNFIAKLFDMLRGAEIFPSGGYRELACLRQPPQHPEKQIRYVRKHVVIAVLQVLHDPLPEMEKTTAECIRLYFESITQPFVTVKELEELPAMVRHLQSFLDSGRMKESMEKFERLFPESAVLQPRTLQHLSRCALRESLSKKGLLPYLVERLPVPKSIKDYILIT